MVYRSSKDNCRLGKSEFTFFSEHRVDIFFSLITAVQCLILLIFTVWELLKRALAQHTLLRQHAMDSEFVIWSLISQFLKKS